MNEPIRLLHLSDIHFRGRAQWDADPILLALAHFIADEVRRGLAPDLVVITGDLAFAGRKDEYALAKAWLDQDLWPALTTDPSAPLPRERLLLVPGNHDVDRDQVDAVARMVQNGLLDRPDQDQIAAILASPDQRQTLLKRHAAYLRFYADWLGVPQPLPWWQRTIHIRDQRLHVAGLDSAWMACGDQDRGRLLLGRYQVHQTVLHQDAEGADWRLALLHHPWDYLAEIDTRSAPESIHLHRDLVLRGHLHEPDAYRILPPDPRRACLELAAGSVYDGSPYANAFQWIELYPAPRRARIHFRLWNKGAWQPDHNQPGDDDHDGAVDFLLDQSTTASNPTQPDRAPTIPAAWLDWLRGQYESIELLGLEAQAQHPTHLSQVYVPAITPARQAAAPGGSAGRPDDRPQHELLIKRLGEASLYCPGDPGAGKSTFCRWLALVVAGGAVPAHPIAEPDAYRETCPDPLRDRLPVLVPLRDFWPALPLTPGGHQLRPTAFSVALGQWLCAWAGGRLDPATFAALLDAGRCLLILDGIDEVPIIHGDGDRRTCPRAGLLSALADGLADWTQAGNRLLLTSRPHGLRPEDLRRLHLPEAALAALDDTLQALFIRRWYAAADPAQGADKARGLLAHLADRPDLQELKRNPMLLTALCVRYGEGRRLPQDRHDLYDKLYPSQAGFRFLVSSF